MYKFALIFVFLFAGLVQTVMAAEKQAMGAMTLLDQLQMSMNITANADSGKCCFESKLKSEIPCQTDAKASVSPIDVVLCSFDDSYVMVHFADDPYSKLSVELRPPIS